MKKAAGLIMLLLVGLLVAMPVAASTIGVFNGADALTVGTKIMTGEEVAGYMVAGENMTALAVPPWADVVSITIIVLAAVAICMAYLMRSDADLAGYKSTPGAGGDGFARFS